LPQWFQSFLSVSDLFGSLAPDWNLQMDPPMGKKDTKLLAITNVVGEMGFSK